MPHALCVLIVLLVGALYTAANAQPEAGPATNLALVAEASTSYVSGHETIRALNDGHEPRHSNDKSRGAYGNWPRKGTQWVQYDWSQPISTRRIDVYWFDDRGGVRLPKECRLLYWDGNAFVPVPNPSGLGVVGNRFNPTTFDAIRTSRLRLEFDSSGESTGLLEWKVYDSGQSPNFKPVVEAGVDRVFNTVEAMCFALMVDPQGDAEIAQAQEAIRRRLEDWIPKLLSAQEPDGYLQTYYTLNNRPR